MALAPSNRYQLSLGGSDYINQPYTDTVIKGPSTSVQTQVGGGTQTTNSRENWREVTNDSRVTNDRTVQTQVNKNMDDEAYNMLMQYLRQQLGGGSPEDIERRNTIFNEIAANQAQRAGYSKEAAWIDSNAAAGARMSQALEEMVPVITAGIDSAGTSGSAMAALLANKAAEAVSRNAAQLQLEASISYGQIANQASSIIAELLGIQSSEQNNILRGLEIAKGARTSATTTTNRTITEKGTSTRSGSRSSSSSTVSNNYGTTTTHDSGGMTTSSRTFDKPASTIGYGGVNNYELGRLIIGS